ncbi:uncharacterized protein LOC117652040 [Thrips palmi]|uniref:Uncharacterized protein LOC117652040 n=1 Tax=Thrips palmi TaxID=161013 RepID=A0A6P9A4X8_THRPL|nr:uncharacterized protein LOC117652040 [Thrips palmi]
MLILDYTLKMNCFMCFEEFNSCERRPKVLPCGHTFCLRCLLDMPFTGKVCPVDNKEFPDLPDALKDDFKLLSTLQRPAGFWCLACRREATEGCVEEHAVRSLQRVRADESNHEPPAVGVEPTSWWTESAHATPNPPSFLATGGPYGSLQALRERALWPFPKRCGNAL